MQLENLEDSPVILTFEFGDFRSFTTEYRQFLDERFEVQLTLMSAGVEDSQYSL